ncbi:nicotinate-nucleotide--dimethylbenzimidazole phosphoribosyltransferase [Paenibacillus methanolicus]|uniref:Nicotinate-nucleotide--dimethylbenzimidazole phosphoribosyltransferase n=1 Tax=Paenibacillus methanolicus TaxID=582686 RepID=A0A5S5CEJ3_9BACL|nr:nicotinate-nucleotide--dimethylbenzimidazole phosphoribosyltransferase [Paenibacillus methanolicus]TYP77559.1 nicotinate-nucleotide--dimethylbenzimidazole phosphoribosyltransferase [Paenibacillus methanolicus]
MSVTKQLLDRTVAAIGPLDAEAVHAAQARLDSLTKPPGSLGKLEDIAKQTAGITGEIGADLSKRAVVVMAGDHGVCSEGVSAFPSEVTPQMVLNFLAGGAAVNVLARQAGADVVCVDVGVATVIEHPSLVQRKVRPGTGNMAQGPAMSREEALAAIAAGIETASELAGQGYAMLATGEMGIGNTTPSAALCAALAHMTAEEAVGLGTGIDASRRRHKVDVVERALAVNAPNADDPLDALAKVGGLEIAALTGVMLGAAANRLPVIIDGFISSAAALVASRIAPASVPYMIGSHLSQEQGHGQLMAAIGLSPMIHLDMRLGEGTGAVLGFHIVDAAQRIVREMATFESAGVSKG